MKYNDKGLSSAVLTLRSYHTIEIKRSQLGMSISISNRFGCQVGPSINIAAYEYPIKKFARSTLYNSRFGRRSVTGVA